MKKQNSNLSLRTVAIILVAALLTPIGVQAVGQDAIMPRGSDYLAAYNAYICAMGDGKLEIWFRVTGTDYWADIGVLNIRLYESTDNENWTWVMTYLHERYDTMLAHDTFAHMSHVDYQGVEGRYYKAYVTIWAGPEDGGDARYIWTPVELAT